MLLLLLALELPRSR